MGEIRRGRVVVPKFQRDYIWNTKQRLELFDSISKGFPIGSLLFWSPELIEFGFNNKIGPYELDLDSDKHSYIIDGYQRITTLFSALTNPDKYTISSKDEHSLYEYIIYYDLKNEEFIHKSKSKVRSNEVDYSTIPLYILVDTFDFLTYSKNIQEEFDEETSKSYINRAKNLATALVDYEIAFVSIDGGSIKDAVEIFSRINSKGSDMSPMWMLSALTYDEEGGFKFSDEVDQLKSALGIFNFQDIKTEIILQCIESSTGKIYFDVKTESLAKRDDFKLLCINTFENIYNAVEFLFNRLHVTNLRLLPYNLQLIFITEFFRTVDQPSEIDFKELEKWFWQTTYASYFSIYSLSKQRKAFAQFQDWCRGVEDHSLFKANKNENFETPDFPTSIFYGSVRSKALALFLIKTIVDGSKSHDSLILKDFQSLSKNDKDAALAVPIFEGMDYGDYKKNRGDYSFLLDPLDGFNPKLNFIDNNFTNFKGSDEKLKNKRYKLISQKESAFVESLSINYPWNWRYNDDPIPFE